MTEEARVRLSGVMIGFSVGALIGLAWLALGVIPGMRAAYRDFGGSLPLASRLVMSPLWLWGTVAFGVVATAALGFRRPRSLVPYATTTLILVTAVLLTWQLAHAPLYALAY